MDGGSVGGNLACRGGGIYVTGEGTTLNVSGGTITGNQAVVETTKTSVVDANGDTSRSVYVAGGGGVAAWMGASVNITGGSISENTSSSNGGGVMVGFSTTLEDIGVTTLTMAGGTVSDNTAADNGGGIFVASGTTTGYSTATISGGAITGNQAAVYEGNDFHTFAGGGIYVNGIQHQSGDTYHDGVLYLRNALITNNAVNSEGGGIAACPTSSLTFYASDGAAIVDNYSSAGDQTDIYVGGANNPYLYGEPSYVVSATMLGGAPYNWKSGDTNKTVGLASLEGTLTISGLVNSSHLSLYTDERANQATQSLATTIISGNTSGTSGGGIGANGTVIIGTEDDTQLRVVKQWSDANDAAGIHPDSVDVRLYRQTRATNGTLGEATLIGYATLTPGDDGSWSDTITFTHLPKADGDGNAYVYSVSDDVTGYRADTASSVDEDGVVLVTLTNTASVQVQVTKAWDDGDDADGIRPGSVTVHLLANGEDTGKTLVLTGEDGWSGAFADLDRYDSEGNEISYRVSEDVPEGYASTVTGDAASGFTITNSHTPGQHTTTTTKTTTSRTRIVETGDTTSVVPVVGVVVAGAALVAGGACLRRRTRR